MACSKTWSPASKNLQLRVLAWVFGFLTILCSGRELSIREAAVFIFIVFFYSTTVALQVVAVISISEGFDMITEIFFLADAVKHLIAVKPQYNDLLYIQHHWQDNIKLCTAN